MNQKRISMDNWPRRDIFRHFIDDLRCVITVTSRVDVTETLGLCRERGQRFYPTFLYLVASALNRREEWRLRQDETGALLCFGQISPSHIIFHPEDELFTRLITPYSPDFQTFYVSVTEDMARNGDKRAFEVQAEGVGATFDASCLPWLDYSACDLHVYDSGCYLAPIVTWGRYTRQGERMILPLTMQVHHAVADGFHVARFYQDLSAEMESLIDRIG